MQLHQARVMNASTRVVVHGRETAASDWFVFTTGRDLPFMLDLCGGAHRFEPRGSDRTDMRHVPRCYLRLPASASSYARSHPTCSPHSPFSPCDLGNGTQSFGAWQTYLRRNDFRVLPLREGKMGHFPWPAEIVRTFAAAQLFRSRFGRLPSMVALNQTRI